MVTITKSEQKTQLLLTKAGYDPKVVEMTPSKNQLVKEALVSNAPVEKPKARSQRNRSRTRKSSSSKPASSKPKPKPKPASRLDDYLD